LGGQQCPPYALPFDIPKTSDFILMQSRVFPWIANQPPHTATSFGHWDCISIESSSNIASGPEPFNSSDIALLSLCDDRHAT
jgi:hypothetical protein